MANPQLEDGYTKVANEILGALVRINLSPYESRVLWFIIRQTYGWKKKADLISLSQIVQGTGIAKGNASRSLKYLILRQIVIRLDNKQLGFNKDYDSWLQKLSAEITIEPEQESPVSEVIGTDNNSAEEKLSAEIPKLSAEIPPPTCEKLSAEIPQKKEYKETIQKKTVNVDKGKTVEKFIQELRQRFPMLNFDVELEKFNLYWTEGKRELKRPKLALLNWMTIAQRRLEKEGIGGKTGQGNRTDGWKDWAPFAGGGDAPDELCQRTGESKGSFPMGD